MERQRVIYVAKSKTAKVIRSSVRKHPLSQPPSSTSETEVHHAPLASIEPDTLMVSRRASATVKPLNSRRQVRNPASNGNICNNQTVHADNVAYSHEYSNSHKELRECTPPRMYVRSRSTRASDVHRDNPQSTGNQKHNRVLTGQAVPRGVSPSGFKSRQDNQHDLSSSDHKLPIRGTHNIPPEHVSHNGTNNSCLRTFDDKMKIPAQNVAVPLARRRSNYSTEQKLITDTPPPVAPKPKRICTETATVLSSSKSNFALSENGTLDSNPPSMVKQGGFLASKENYIRSSHNYDETILDNTQVVKEKVRSSWKPKRNIRKSPERCSTPPAETQSNQDCADSSKNHNFLALLPEMILPVEFSSGNREPLPEMYSNSEIRPRSIPGAVAHSSHMPKSKSSHRKPLASIDTSFNTSLSESKETNTLTVFTDNHIHDTQSYPDSESQLTQITVDSRKQSNDENSKNCPQAGQVLPENSDILPVSEFRHSWNRSSMRLATHGYTSMSDLTNSTEHLADQQQDSAAIECSKSPDDTINNHDRKCEDISAEDFYQAEQKSQIFDPAQVSYEQEKPKLDMVLTDVKEGQGPAEDPDTLNICQEEPVVTLERNGIKRLSYRMATLSISDLSILEADMDENGENNHQIYVMVKNGRNRESDTSNAIRGYESMRQQGRSDGTSHEPPASDIQSHLSPLSHVANEEQLYKLKRLSFTLATASISDLTFPDVEFSNAIRPFSVNEKINKKSNIINNSMESTDSTNTHTPESQNDQFRESSCSSSGRHSSFGSVYSFQSLDTGKFKSLQEPQSKSKPSFKSHFKESTHPANDSTDSDGSASCDTSYYYTASSDTSFVTTDGDPLSGVQVGGTPHRLPLHEQRQSSQVLTANHRSPRISSRNQKSPKLSSRDQNPHTISPQGQRSAKTVPHDYCPPNSSQQGQKSPRPSPQSQRSHKPSPQDQKQKSHNDNHQILLEHNKNQSNYPRKLILLPHNETPSKRHNPINNVLQCYGCGSNDRYTVLIPRNRSIAGVSNSNQHSRHECSHDYLQQNHSKHSTERIHVRHADTSPRRLQVQIRTFAETDVPAADRAPTSGIASNHSFNSEHSSEQLCAWDETPRFPPSLGKPRRKLYAGFDSQPLPMDSFISDSSSVYSIQTCGSWGASRSAEAGSISRTHDMSSSMRSVSSIVSSTYAPVRCLSQDELFDLVTFTDKKFSSQESNHNLYFDDRFKDSIYNKVFSRQSLDSLHSDDTTVGVDHQVDPDQSLEYMKSCIDLTTRTEGVYNNADIVAGSENTRHDRRQLDKLNNSCGLELGSRLSNKSSCFVDGNLIRSKNQLKAVKAKKSGQQLCVCGQSSMEVFTVGDTHLSLIFTENGKWDLSM